MRTDEGFKLFWERVTREANALGIDEPVLPRKRKVPRRFDSNNDIGTTPVTPEDYYRPMYFEALDTAVSCIKDRFDQEGYKMYSKLELLLLKACKHDQNYEEYDDVFELYQGDIRSTNPTTDVPYQL